MKWENKKAALLGGVAAGSALKGSLPVGDVSR